MANTSWRAPAGGVAYSRYESPFMWTDHRYDAPVGLYATQYRTYSPTLAKTVRNQCAMRMRPS